MQVQLLPGVQNIYMNMNFNKILFLFFSVLFAITPPEKGLMPGKWDKYFRENNIGMDYGNSAWHRKLNYKTLSRSTEADSFFIPVIMANYTDETGTITSEEYFEHLFGNNPTGSFSDYYSEVSYGKFYATGHVYGWYDTEKSKSEAVDDARSFISSILELSDADIDFSMYDNDGPDNIPNSGDDDGYVDGLIVIFPGNGADSNIDPDNMWPHAWGVHHNNTTSDDAYNGGFIKVHNYTLCPEKYNNDIRPIGVYVHEFGHILGLPDLYDTTDDEDTEHDFHNGIGNWGVMAQGSWLGYPGGKTPSHFSAWSKIKLGWVDPVEIGSGSYSLSSDMDTKKIYKIVGSNYSEDPLAYINEYFLLENRNNIGFDQELPGEGMLIFHVDESINNNRDRHHKQVDLEEADGTDDLDYQNNRGDNDDPYPSLLGSNTAFSDITYPNNYNYNNIAGTFDISNIQVTGDGVAFDMEKDNISGEHIAYDTDYSYGSYGWNDDKTIYAGVLFQSNLSGYIKGIDIKLPGSNDGNHIFDISIYDALNDGYVVDEVYSKNISINTHGWYHIDIDSDIFVDDNEEFFIYYKIINGTYDVYVDEDVQHLSNRSYVKVNESEKFNLITYGNITLRAWIEHLPLSINGILPHPDIYALYNAYPNPFNPITTLRYAMPKMGYISINIYDLSGRKIENMFNGIQQPGNHTIIWDSSEYTSGIYFAKMTAGQYINTQKLMLIK